MASDYLPTMAGNTTPDTTVPVPTAGAQTLRVVHITGSQAGTVQELTPGMVLVGRHPESRVRFDHTVDFLVSTRHGQFVHEQGQWYLVDTNSTNGTWVNGSRVQRHPLTQGQLVVLGTPGAPGSASFKIDFDGSASASVVDGDAAFAQEPPSSSELVRFTCQNCGALDSAPESDIGQSVECGVCGKKTKVVPAPAAMPAHRPLPPQGGSLSMGAPPVLSPPQAHGSPVVVPNDSSFFGGIIGNVKGKINRMKETRELSKEITGIESQLPSLEASVQQACTTLGHDLWKTRDPGLSMFAAAAKLTSLDQAVEQVIERRKAAEEAAARQATEQEVWMEEWQARQAALEADLALAVQTLADARAEQARSREAVVAAVADRATAMSTIAAIMAELSGEARGEPRDDFANRYQAAMTEVGQQLPELQLPIDGWAQKVQARTAAADALQRALQAEAQATQKVQASLSEKAVREVSRAEQVRTHEQQMQAIQTEIERIRQQAPPYYAELGRDYAQTAAAPPINPPLPSLSAARRAIESLKQAQGAIAQKKQRLNELT